MNFSQDLFNYVSFNPNKEGDYAIIIPNLNGLATISLKLMMYRLNNIDGRVTIYILDKKSITKKDVESGIYTENDFGKFRVDVFIKRVAVNFDITTCDVIKLNNFNELNLIEENIIMLDCIESSTNKDNSEIFMNILRNKAFKRFQTNNMYIKVDNNKGFDYVTIDCYSRQTYEAERFTEELSYYKNTNKRVREVIISRIISGLINIMVTEDFTLTKNSYGIDSENKVITKSLEEV